MTTEQTIDYETLAQEAMRGVVRTVLQKAAKFGLPGDHHFYISFETQAAGVALSKRLKEKYPSEMTIVLQHRFWDLNVSDDRFEVKLTFDGIPERLVVPFSAIKVFFDPSVRYGLQFEEPDFTADSVDQSVSSLESNYSSLNGDSDPEHAEPTSLANAANRRSHNRRRDDNAKEPAADVVKKHSPAQERALNGNAEQSDGLEAEANEEEAELPATVGAEIVSLDAFRKK